MYEDYDDDLTEALDRELAEIELDAELAQAVEDAGLLLIEEPAPDFDEIDNPF